jgi:hypothetical protein
MRNLEMIVTQLQTKIADLEEKVAFLMRKAQQQEGPKTPNNLAESPAAPPPRVPHS